MTRMRMGVAWFVLCMPLVLVLVVVLLIATYPDARSHPRDRAPVEGCTEVEASELYVQHAYTCNDGTSVLTFVDVTARDAYLGVAEHYGLVALSKGSTWIRVRTL